MDRPAASCVNYISGIIHRCLCRFWRSPIALKILPRKKRRRPPAGRITSADAFHSKIAADRKVGPPIPHSSVTQRWGARSINRCDHHKFAGASGAVGVSVRWGLASVWNIESKFWKSIAFGLSSHWSLTVSEITATLSP